LKDGIPAAGLASKMQSSVKALVDAASEQLLFTAVLRCVGDRLRSVLVGSGTRLLPDE
jgi:hypothetical protein